MTELMKTYPAYDQQKLLWDTTFYQWLLWYEWALHYNYDKKVQWGFGGGSKDLTREQVRQKIKEMDERLKR